MTTERKNDLIGALLLTICAIVWGSSFVAQTTGAEFLGPFSFISFRSLIGSATLLIVIGIKSLFSHTRSREKVTKKETQNNKYLFLGGAVCGVCLCVASVLQQIGIDKGTPPGRAGFITAMYILLVPIISVVIGKKIRPLIWLCVAISISGLYLLCVNDSKIASSDIYVLICALCYAIHILIIDKVSARVDGIKLSCIQFFVCGVIALIPAILTETITLELVKNGLLSLLYSGLMSSAVGYTLQILGQQKLTKPTIASMLMSLESVFSVLTGMLVLKQIPSAKEAIGCVLMFGAIILAQLPENKLKLKRKEKQNDT